jgi:hypothetical protein
MRLRAARSQDTAYSVEMRTRLSPVRGSVIALARAVVSSSCGPHKAAFEFSGTGASSRRDRPLYEERAEKAPRNNKGRHSGSADEVTAHL